MDKGRPARGGLFSFEQRVRTGAYKNGFAVEWRRNLVHYTRMSKAKSGSIGLAALSEHARAAPHSTSRSPIKVVSGYPDSSTSEIDVYFSADVETDGPIPGPFSMVSFALVYAGAFDGTTFYRPLTYDRSFYVELKPISDQFEQEALDVNRLDRQALVREGKDPAVAMDAAADWVRRFARDGAPVIVAYPLSFDWSWLYWYFVRYATDGSPFGYSRAYDIKTAIAAKLGQAVAASGHGQLPLHLRATSAHTHHARDDAVEQAEIFANVFTMGQQ